MTTTTMPARPNVRERPILFSAPMVRAILDGTKTQTRRRVKLRHPSDVLVPDHGPKRNVPDVEQWWKSNSGHYLCPYGAPGDRLWVREAWSAQYEFPLDYQGDHLAWHYQTPPAWRLGSNAMRTYYRGDRSVYDVCDYGEQGIDLVRQLSHGEAPKWVPAIHMPRWASRLTLQVTDVRVERLQEISEEDALAEGITRVEPSFADRRAGCTAEDVFFLAPGVRQGWGTTKEMRDQDRWAPRAGIAYRILWDFINAKRGHGWDTNPWVWVVSFSRLEGAA